MKDNQKTLRVMINQFGRLMAVNCTDDYAEKLFDLGWEEYLSGREAYEMVDNVNHFGI